MFVLLLHAVGIKYSYALRKVSLQRRI